MSERRAGIYLYILFSTLAAAAAAAAAAAVAAAAAAAACPTYGLYLLVSHSVFCIHCTCISDTQLMCYLLVCLSICPA